MAELLLSGNDSLLLTHSQPLFDCVLQAYASWYHYIIDRVVSHGIVAVQYDAPSVGLPFLPKVLVTFDLEAEVRQSVGHEYPKAPLLGSVIGCVASMIAG